MNEDFVSFNLAKKLKEKGYTLDTAHHYDDNGGVVISLVEFDERCVYPCPEIHQVLKWLREVHNIFIVIEPYMYDYINEKISSYVTSLWQGDNYYENITSKDYPTYEEAALEGITWALDNLI